MRTIDVTCLCTNCGKTTKLPFEVNVSKFGESLVDGTEPRYCRHCDKRSTYGIANLANTVKNVSGLLKRIRNLEKKVDGMEKEYGGKN